MSADNSPSYAQGQLDGAADAERNSSHPGNCMIGPTPPNPAYPVMYMRGYDSIPKPGHAPCEQCKREQEGQQ